MSEKLTPEQEDLMLAYDNKWWEIMYATEPMDNKKAADAIKEAYLVIGEKEPEIIFCHSPYEAVNLVLRGKSITQLYEEFGVNLVDQFTEKLYCKTLGSIMAQTSNESSSQLFRKAWMSFSALFKKLLESIFCHDPFHYNEDYEFLDYIIWAELAARCDFCFSVLKFKYHRRRWQALKSLTTQCGWIFPYEKVCIICDRPRLIQGIGYDRICQELAAIELDSWQEYTLLSIDFADDFDDEGNTKPVYLLKMTCPSTGLIHALRVPPDINSAREASRWTNWGIDPENFSVQT